MFLRFRVCVFLMTIASSGVDTYIFPCYYTNWAQHRPGRGSANPWALNTRLCTHIVHAYASLDGGKVSNYDDSDDAIFQFYRALKSLNPTLKVLVAVGGWNAGSGEFSNISSTEENRRVFEESAARYLRRKNADGLVLDWEFPEGDDKQRFTQLCRDVRAYFEREVNATNIPRLALVASVRAVSITNHYQVSYIHQYLDFVFLMSYDYRGYWDRPKVLGHHTDMRDVKRSVVNWLKLGMPKEKLVLGLAAYGLSYVLADDEFHDPGDGFKRPGDEEVYTGHAGMMSYYEVCSNTDIGWTQAWDKDACAPYTYGRAHSDNFVWVSYDNQRSIVHKLHYVKRKSLAGAFLWTEDLDDFFGFCEKNRANKFPLTRLIHYHMITCGEMEPPPVTRVDCSVKAFVDTAVRDNCTQSLRMLAGKAHAVNRYGRFIELFMTMLTICHNAYRLI